MKIRLGFVSNSSSSSFIVSQESIDVTIPKIVIEYSKEATKEKIVEHLFAEEKRMYLKYGHFNEKKTLDKLNNEYTNALNILKNVKDYADKVDKEYFEEKVKNKYGDIFYYIRTQNTREDLAFWAVKEASSLIGNNFKFKSLYYMYIKFVKYLFECYKKTSKNNDFVEFFIKILKLKFKTKKGLKDFKRKNNLDTIEKFVTYFDDGKLYQPIDYLEIIESFLSTNTKKKYSYQTKKINRFIKNIKRKTIMIGWDKVQEKLKRNISTDKQFYELKIQDGGGCGVYSQFLHDNVIPIPSEMVFSNH